MCSLVENFENLIDIALINGYVLFKIHQKNSLENESLKQTRPYSVREFREEVVHFKYLKFEK